MDRKYVESVWLLFRTRFRRTYKSKKIEPEFILREKHPSVFPAIASGGSDFDTYESHSARSAWVFHPWKDGKNWYPGFEYKGIGERGRGIRRFAGTAWGGVYKDWALAEHRFSKIAYDAGVFCQRPIGAYDYGVFYGKPLAVLVRSFVCPIRLSDFLFERKFFESYLELRGESEKGYCRSISAVLGRNVRRLFDIGLYHGSMGSNNLTAEGELADFEPTCGGTGEGLKKTKSPFLRYVALRRVLHAGNLAFPKYSDEFKRNFADAFFGKETRLRTTSVAREIAEAYCGRRIKEPEVKPGDNDQINKILKQLEHLRDKAKTEKERQLYEYALKSVRTSD